MCRVVTCHVKSCRVMSCHVMSCNVLLSRMLQLILPTCALLQVVAEGNENGSVISPGNEGKQGELQVRGPSVFKW